MMAYPFQFLEAETIVLLLYGYCFHYLTYNCHYIIYILVISLCGIDEYSILQNSFLLSDNIQSGSVGREFFIFYLFFISPHTLYVTF